MDGFLGCFHTWRPRSETRGLFAAFGAVLLKMCEHNKPTDRTEISEKRLSGLGSISALERFLCSDNTADPAATVKSLVIFYPATGAKRWLVSVDMVSYLYALLSSLSFFGSLLINFNVSVSISPNVHEAFHQANQPLILLLLLLLLLS